MLKQLIATIVLLTLLGLAPINAPSAMAGDGAKYELTMRLLPGADLLAKGAKPIVVTPKEEPSHVFDSKDECEAHAAMDTAGNAAYMAENLGLVIDKDFTITHSCDVQGQDI